MKTSFDLIYDTLERAGYTTKDMNWFDRFVVCHPYLKVLLPLMLLTLGGFLAWRFLPGSPRNKSKA